MPSEVIAALLGALIGFAGTYLIQRGQWRRGELEQARLRLGAIRALAIDLRAAELTVRVADQRKVLVAGSRFPTQAWFTHGHLVLGVLKSESVDPLMQVFGRFDSMNSMIAAAGTTDFSEEREFARSLTDIKKGINTALILLARFEVEVDSKRDRLQRPWGVRIDRLRSKLRG